MHASNNNERRKHRLFVTQNTEYHLREETCVGVRDLWSGRWREDHPAVGRRLFGAVIPGPDGLEQIGEPSVNCLLWFENGENDILTSRLTAITRPPKNVVTRYAA
ncbi:MAG: hypothetical protein ACON3Z_07015 [Bradymonadia bacterium]